ncbi:MAG: glucose-6-phosphate dehydrogenase (NADP(+)) [Candidatus Moranbacteria bacterium]|nr:glucose-6-phosphate dehydrogenase (NADP(+)) [Candidatus Moranbacteria bacterium]OIQ04315.1 MAG: hypothetical protein AUK58_01055 [Candidatus Moranbacteria bacterium CG2_30_41_165]PIP25516.1 MAG: hypothetical protein COX32_02900 [Candidatus Moranbacteria bacterium CG23_combo_of_CG06-09_8_20_14_all_41_28]PIV85953.1 MAG: hypothetical protein COW50_04280 [Candidatus Moranbacteria bacterium CG17_big_fil_post_rev_8_21_14_2_50_41_107]PIW93745.1 MAG: hypothetical protein COZ86_04720 [Candidatus Mora
MDISSNNQKEFVLFGASGDLAKEKLYPALFDVFQPTDTIRYIGYARTVIRNDAFKKIVRDSVLKKYPEADAKKLDIFIDRFEYCSGTYDAHGIEQLKRNSSTVDRYYYLALPSSYTLLKDIVDGLSVHGLNKKSIIVLEKPFGSDKLSAKRLNELLLKHFSEDQIYRIDHYLAKDLVQDMLAMRFANPIFWPIWNNTYIESITISIKESEGIRDRGQYYDQAGAIKDMIQNHAMQLLAFTVMDQPKSLSASAIHKEKIRIFENIQLFNNDTLHTLAIGQYEGYRNEQHIPADSMTETYASMTVEIDVPEWRGVPIRIVSGKKLDEKTTDIIITFKKTNSNLWEKEGCQIERNQIRINVQPHNDIHLRLNSEFNSTQKCALPINLHFGFKDNKHLLKDPYENALRDLFNNDQSIFIGSQEILLAWKFIDTVLETLNISRAKNLEIYDHLHLPRTEQL